METRQARAQYLTARLSEADVSLEQKKYTNLFDECMTSTKGDVLAAYDLMAMEDKNLRAGINRTLSAQGSKYRISYNNVYDDLGETDKMRAAGLYDDTSAANAGILIQTSVADYILSRVEELGQVIKLVSRFTVADGNITIPKFANNTIAQFGVAGAALVNGNLDLGGITLNPTQYGIYVSLTLQYLAKVNPKNMYFVMEKMAEAMSRAQDRAIVSGSGLNGNPLGILANATAIPFVGGDNMFDTVDKGMGILSQVLVPNNKITILINGAQLQLAMRTRRTTSNYGTYLVMNPENAGEGTIDGMKYVVTEQILSAGSAGSQTAPLLMGNFAQYYWGDNGTIKTVIDNYSGITNLTQKVVMYGFADGRPAFKDSFAKQTLTTGL